MAPCTFCHNGFVYDDPKAINRRLLRCPVCDGACQVEPGAEGLPQLVIPGCDHVSHGARAQRLADQPIRPKAAQLHTMPERGLWGDHGQGDLFT